MRKQPVEQNAFMDFTSPMKNNQELKSMQIDFEGGACTKIQPNSIASLINGILAST